MTVPASTVSPGASPSPISQIACVVGDSVDLTPVGADAKLYVQLALTTKPGGSSASLSGATFSPDVGGAYVATQTFGGVVVPTTVDAVADVAVVSGGFVQPSNYFAFTSSVYNSLLTVAITGATRDDATVRRILAAAAKSLSVATLTAWNSGTFPPVDLRQFGA